MIVPEIGLDGQLAIRAARVLVVGAGGLGAAAIAYLAGAGVGTLGIADDDTVATSNLHRQIVHSCATVGRPKAESAAAFARALNPRVRVRAHVVRVEPANVFDLVDEYDIVVDCVDAPQTRYLLSDAAVAAGRPVVAASALRAEGQLLVLNHAGGPCYRCVVPVAPAAAAVAVCEDAGIVGPVVGAMGVLQATEALRLAAGLRDPAAPPTMLMYAALHRPMWREVRLRGRRPDCAACGAAPTITRAAIAAGAVDYVAFCGAPPPAPPPAAAVSPAEYAAARAGPHTLVDVRERVQFGLCALPGAVNLPLAELDRPEPLALAGPVYVVCRRGVDSRVAVPILQRRLPGVAVVDVAGGLERWARDVDPSFPRY
ncbi:uncharacterized protein V1510DRAFT_381526 [Dipodascopsis tothii]|uniref:uncharacterized protein n=1 Tax=Dipodascopsis tothii TaxID=44089 RepID=UPI0034CF9B49